MNEYLLKLRGKRQAAGGYNFTNLLVMPLHYRQYSLQVTAIIHGSDGAKTFFRDTDICRDISVKT